ncbi:MAG: hypothetical protein WC822_06280 [Candidatus Paceibacterota bacterium]|jgi:hypothetical protein
MGEVTLEELQQRKMDMGPKLFAAEADYLMQEQRAKDSRDRWVALQGADKQIDSLIRTVKAKVDSEPKVVDNPV